MIYGETAISLADRMERTSKSRSLLNLSTFPGHSGKPLSFVRTISPVLKSDAVGTLALVVAFLGAISVEGGLLEFEPEDTQYSEKDSSVRRIQGFECSDHSSSRSNINQGERYARQAESGAARQWRMKEEANWRQYQSEHTL
jgi:hypothetical protein